MKGSPLPIHYSVPSRWHYSVPRRWSLALLFACPLSITFPAVAQLAAPGPFPTAPAPEMSSDVLRGRVMKQGQGIAGVEVTLHRVTRDSAGVVTTRHSDADGAFAFSIPPRDTAGFTVLLTTADYQGVRYYGPPIHSGETLAGYSLRVYDTVAVPASGAPVRFASRDVVLLPESDGGWEVNEVVTIRNGGERTLVSAGGVPTLELRVPEGVTAFEVGESEVAPDDVKRMGERVLLTGPLPPGTRELYLRYRLPRQASFRVPILHPTDTLNLFVREPAPPVDVEGLAPGEPVRGEGKRFLRFTGSELRPGSEVRVERGGVPAAPIAAIPAAVAVVLTLLSVGTWAAVRWRQAPVTAPG